MTTRWFVFVFIYYIKNHKKKKHIYYIKYTSCIYYYMLLLFTQRTISTSTGVQFIWLKTEKYKQLFLDTRTMYF